MKKFLTVGLVLGMFLAPVLSMGASVLWFGVGADAPLVAGGEEVSTVFAYQDGQGYGINAVRIRITGDGIAEDTFLPLYYEDVGGWAFFSGVTVAELSNGSLAWQPADLSGIGGGSGARVQMELGYLDFEDENAEFIILAYASALISTLDNSGYLSSGGVSTQTQMPWTPEYYDITPEPSTGVLLAVGTVLLMLRRRAGC